MKSNRKGPNKPKLLPFTKEALLMGQKNLKIKINHIRRIRKSKGVDTNRTFV